jgi:hypothetical protein
MYSQDDCRLTGLLFTCGSTHNAANYDMYAPSAHHAAWCPVCAKVPRKFKLQLCHSKQVESAAKYQLVV